MKIFDPVKREFQAEYFKIDEQNYSAKCLVGLKESQFVCVVDTKKILLIDSKDKK